MTLAFKRIKTYVRVSVIALVLMAVLFVLFMNRNNTARFWFFGLTDATKDINVVWLVLSTAAGTRTIWWVFSFAHGLWRDLKELKTERDRQLADIAHAARSKELDDRERQLEQKLQANSEDSGKKEA